MQTILDVVSTVGYYSIFPTLVITPAAIVIGLVLHNMLITRLDPLLFQEPYFHRKELTVLTIWPFTVVKTMGYMMLVVVPKMAKWKRFKGFNETLPLSRFLVALCYVELVLLVFLMLVAIVLMTTGALSVLLS
ncbi:hypothetical protein EDC38_1809 [Marinimicrobium koreense]|uniref:Uncharacterized protein n=1 Tax=Marinimicrobium koreense TaxID=306545 RepID=A0A3N1P8Y3_9GAMM|nr:hypothetical protein [Marinimicrobium koreense]ROQ21186.1 hypothetical protein EDC38_1809 [Marinimicrobium koreense]